MEAPGKTTATATAAVDSDQPFQRTVIVRPACPACKPLPDSLAFSRLLPSFPRNVRSWLALLRGCSPPPNFFSHAYPTQTTGMHPLFCELILRLVPQLTLLLLMVLLMLVCLCLFSCGVFPVQCVNSRPLLLSTWPQRLRMAVCCTSPYWGLWLASRASNSMMYVPSPPLDAEQPLPTFHALLKQRLPILHLMGRQHTQVSHTSVPSYFYRISIVVCPFHPFLRPLPAGCV